MKTLTVGSTALVTFLLAALPAGAAQVPTLPGHLPGTARVALSFEAIPVLLSRPGKDSSQPQIATTPGGVSTVVWQEATGVGANYAIKAARIDARGFASDVYDISPTSSAVSAENPMVSVSPAGVSTIAWREGFGIKAVRLDAKGKLGQVLSLSPTTGIAQPVSGLATAADGTTTVIWLWNGTGNNAVQAIRVDSRGRKGPLLTLSDASRPASGAVIATTAGGTSTIAWSRSDGSNYRIQAVRIDPKGKRGSVLDLSAAGSFASDPSVAATADGTATVAWVLDNGVYGVIQAIRIDPRGTKGPTYDLSPLGGNAVYPKVAMAADKTTTVTWKRYGATSYVLQARRISPTGWRSSVMDLSEPTSDAYDNSNSVSPAGVSTVSWFQSDGSHYVVHAVRIDANGNTGTTIKLSDSGVNSDSPALSTAGNGVATAVWHSILGGPVEVILTSRLR